MIVLIMSFFLYADNSTKAKEDKTYSYSKVPKSLFLIKKAELQASDGEPSLNFADKQKHTIRKDERLVYKP